LPEGVAAGPQRSIFPGTNLEILVPSRVAIAGFLVTWACVGLIIYGFYLITKA